ncbi:hypothetical protein OKW21_004321 [Catalinimonas alkaloidigena]|uniref:hypothetical protein n=1 Tax=Catalinimonas alkaloidigena TaxID=1075417 RepID=UPI0024058AD2|nr:hypothetical protein [Catalinimonas alkaloidigena]MDF9799058.1 hypothetical protein [Catalinimonas alkaloidigena]
MAKPVKVFADLSIQSEDGEIIVKNADDGSLIFDFPTRQSFNNFTEVPLPFKPSLKAIGKANAALLQQRQPVVIRVDHEDWIILGKTPKATLKFVKLAPFYLKQNLSWKDSLYLVGTALGFAIGYLAIRKES